MAPGQVSHQCQIVLGTNTVRPRTRSYAQKVRRTFCECATVE